MNFQELIKECLKEHNNYRRRHGAKPLKHSSSLDKSAERRANNMLLENGVNGSLSNFASAVGENTFIRTGSQTIKENISGSEVAKEWYDEIETFDFSTFRGDAKNFTQMIWKSTREVGFGFGRSDKKLVIVAHYRPSGNTSGNYATNLTPLDESATNGNGFQETCINGALNEAFGEDIRPYIDIIDNMRKYGLQEHVQLPNVVVVGDQSSGKSSIVEVISGIQLPRGSGIVTRCPLELQLKKVFNQPWKAIISYKTKDNVDTMKIIDDPENIQMHVREAQEDLCHTKKGVSKELITLRIESPDDNAPDLTMIDLPGIARTAIEDQPLDICEQIRKIIIKYIENKNTVILCVISGDLDIAVNESINIARQYDPSGERTIGVITKPDIADIDHKKEVIRMMNNEKIKLKKGFNLVKCRSSDQLKKNVALSEFLMDEMDFYENDEIYREADVTRVGALNLSKKITEELVNVIKTNLPELKSNIEKFLDEAEGKVGRLPPGLPQNDDDKRPYMMILASDMDDKIKKFLIFGELNAESNFHHVWRTNFDNFQKAVQKKRNEAFTKELTVEKLREDIIKYRSKEISGFLNYKLFEELLKKHIHKYKSDALDLITHMGGKIYQHLEKLLIDYVSHLPDVKDDIKMLLNDTYQNILKVAEERVDFIFKQEDLVFTMDNVFDRKWGKIIKKKEEDGSASANGSVNNLKTAAIGRSVYQQPSTEAEGGNDDTAASAINDNSKKMAENLRCYLKIVHTRLEDYIPLAVMQCLLVQFHEDLKRQLYQYFSSPDIVSKSHESSTILNQRIKLNDKIACLKRGKFELENKYSIIRI